MNIFSILKFFKIRWPLIEYCNSEHKHIGGGGRGEEKGVLDSRNSEDISSGNPGKRTFPGYGLLPFLFRKCGNPKLEDSSLKNRTKCAIFCEILTLPFSSLF